MSMSVATLHEQQLKTLKNDYRCAWRSFLAEAESLRHVLEVASTDPEAVRVAKSRTEQAATAYRESRNALAAFLLEDGAESKPMATGRAA